MESLWSDEEAAAFAGELAQRVYTSRLLGRDRSLVLHGGGNTSVKLRETDALGRATDLLYVKGSGWDLECIEAAGFAPVDLAHLRALAKLPTLADPQMVNELATHRARADAPAPSVEAILHAILPYKYVDHTHADAFIAVCNSAGGAERVAEIYAACAVVVPYVMPGFALARLCAQRFPARPGPELIGMVLLNHGVFSFGDTARQSYERMIRLVTMAEDYLRSRGAWSVPWQAPAASAAPCAESLARLRRDASQAAGFALVMARRAGDAARAFAARPDLSAISQQGPATPDHVIRTKRVPLLGRDVAAYAREYAGYFAAGQAAAGGPRTMLDPAPRVVLDGELGLCALGRGAADAAACAEIYEHTMEIIARAAALGGYRALPASDIFEVEYWDLEQAKIKRAGRAAEFAGEVAWVTGAASGIGKACVQSLLARGAAVVGIDIDPAVAQLHRRPDYLGIVCDLAAEAALGIALAQAVDAYGGLDMLVVNAGIFPGGCRIEALADADWRRVMQVNLDASFMLLRAAHPLLKLAPRGGRVVVIGSKNVPAPGPGAAAYSASKAALAQLARVAALEWGADGIRVNTLHPNAVFDTALWTPQVLAARAAQYGMSVEAYKRNNVLGVEVRSADVAELAAEVCGPAFARTTGAQIPVDGGNDRVI